MVLDNFSFKNWIQTVKERNLTTVKRKFSKLLFEIFMVFKDDYKASMYLMHEVIKNCEAKLDFYCPKVKATPLLVLAMRNSFKEVIYAIFKNLVMLDLNSVRRVHCDKYDTGNNILHYSVIYDRFVAAFHI